MPIDHFGRGLQRVWSPTITQLNAHEYFCVSKTKQTPPTHQKSRNQSN